MIACAILAATKAHDELKLHVNAALNVGCKPGKIAEIFFRWQPIQACLPLMRRWPSIGRCSRSVVNGPLATRIRCDSQTTGGGWHDFLTFAYRCYMQTDYYNKQ